MINRIPAIDPAKMVHCFGVIWDFLAFASGGVTEETEEAGSTGGFFLVSRSYECLADER